MGRRSVHIPVLLKKVIKVLDPQPGENFIDATYGAGGHSRLIQQKIGRTGRLLAVDWDKSTDAIEGNFADLLDIMQKHHFPPADGLLLDLGFSSDQLEKSGRGFSFKKDEPLLMTYNLNQRSVRELLSWLNEIELRAILSRYGEERHAFRIARAIKERQKKRPIRTSRELAEIIEGVIPRSSRQRIHPATRTFQALRIYANQELENLKKVLSDLEKIMAPGGRVAVITFHSLEDRIVKNKFRELVKKGRAELINKKPIIPSEEEVQNNPRSRSAKLRAIKMR